VLFVHLYHCNYFDFSYSVLSITNTIVMNETECLEEINRFTEPDSAVEALINKATKRWLDKSDYIDDITAIVIFLEKDNEEKPKLSSSAVTWTLLAGAASGFLGGLCAIRGPPIILYFLRPPKSVSFTKKSQRATGACITATNVVMRVVYYAIDALMSGTDASSTFVAEDWRLYVSVSIFSILGVFAGSLIFEKMKDSKETIKLILSLLLLLSGISLIIPSVS